MKWPAKGWYIYFNTSVADHRTSFQDYQVSLELKHTEPSPSALWTKSASRWARPRESPPSARMQAVTKFPPKSGTVAGDRLV